MRLRNPLSMLRSTMLALDMGTGRTRVLSPEGAVLLDEPSLVALEQGASGTHTALVIGAEAKTYLGKTPERIRVARPLEAGAVADLEAARLMLQGFFSRVLPGDGGRLKACVTAPQGLTDMERRTLAACCKSAGVSRVDFLSAPLAAALGAGLDITKPKGLLLLGVGAGRSEASVISLSGVVESASLPLGTLAFHAAVAQHLAFARQIAIGENMAEHLTTDLATAVDGDTGRRAQVLGKFAATGAPCSLELAEADLRGALDEPVEALVGLVRTVLDKAPTDLVADIGETGLHLYGGGAQLSGLAEHLAKTLGLRVALVADPGLAQARGAALALPADSPFRKLLVRA